MAGASVLYSKISTPCSGPSFRREHGGGKAVADWCAPVVVISSALCLTRYLQPELRL
jgi:hypothetical protein